jgi:hypothetical protein
VTMQKDTCPVCCFVSEKSNLIPLKYLVAVIFISGVAAVILMVSMGTINETLVSAEPGYDIIDFEIAFTQEKAGEILATWGPPLEREALTSLYIDFAYLVSYAAFLSSLAVLVTRRLRGALETTGVRVIIMPWAAAFLDVLENLSLISVIKTSAASKTPVLLAGCCAVVKFLLVGIVIVFVVAGGIYVLIKISNK